MQTFLPYPSFLRSATALDSKRLGKQRVEAWQLLRTLLGETSGWRHHPAVKMWSGHERWLCLYGIVVCDVWIGRGFKDTLRGQFWELLDRLPQVQPPSWLGDGRFHTSHRSNLLRKDSVFYGRFGWSEPPDLPYVWPSGGR